MRAAMTPTCFEPNKPSFQHKVNEGYFSALVTPHPHRARSSAAQRKNGKFSIVCTVLLSAATAALCVNTLLGNSCISIFCTASRRRYVTSRAASRALCGRGVRVKKSPQGWSSGLQVGFPVPDQNPGSGDTSHNWWK